MTIWFYNLKKSEKIPTVREVKTVQFSTNAFSCLMPVFIFFINWKQCFKRFLPYNIISVIWLHIVYIIGMLI